MHKTSYGTEKIRQKLSLKWLPAAKQLFSKKQQQHQNIMSGYTDFAKDPVEESEQFK